MGKYMGKCMSKTCIYLFNFLRIVGNAVKKCMEDVDKFKGGGSKIDTYNQCIPV